MTVHTLDPLRDVRWSELAGRHPRGSVFHSTPWLDALHRTYGYEPVAFTTSPPGDSLEDGIVFCDVRSWLTGRRLVSLPFSDHCEPLVTSGQTWDAIADQLHRMRGERGWDYIELRPLTQSVVSAHRTTIADRFWVHALNLQPGADALFRAFHRDSIQRKVRRAARERLEYEEASSDRLLHEFYQLLVLTRRRHQLPPQPLAWFRNLAAAFGAAMKVRIARQAGRPVAAIVTLRHRDVMVYKYGASDERFHSLGGMHLLLWATIQDACSNGCTTLDLGRCDMDNAGLATFKERWGATKSEIAYRRIAATPSSQHAFRKYALGGVRQVLGHAPAACRVAAGKFLYRHAG